MTNRPPTNIGPPNPNWDPSRLAVYTSVTSRMGVGKGGDQYSVNEFYTMVKDQHHNYEQANIKMPGYVLDAISELISIYPMMKTRQDFIRNAVVHAVYHYAISDVDLSPATEKLVMDMLEAENTRSKQDALTRHVENLESTRELCNSYVTIEDWDGLNEMHQMYANKLYENFHDDMPESRLIPRDIPAQWRRDYEQRYKDIGRLMDQLDPYDRIEGEYDVMVRMERELAAMRESGRS